MLIATFFFVAVAVMRPTIVVMAHATHCDGETMIAHTHVHLPLLFGRVRPKAAKHLVLVVGRTPLAAPASSTAAAAAAAATIVTVGDRDPNARCGRRRSGEQYGRARSVAQQCTVKFVRFLVVLIKLLLMLMLLMMVMLMLSLI